MGFKEYLKGDRLSFRARLGLVFSALLALVIGFSVLLVFVQHRATIGNNEASLRAYRQMIWGREMRESLTALDQEGFKKEDTEERIAHFRKALDSAASESGQEEYRELLDAIARNFHFYVAELSLNSPAESVRNRWEDVAASVSAFMEFHENMTFRMADALIRKQQLSISLTLSFLFAIIVLMMVGGYKIIGIMTQPLSALASFVDHLNLEDELPARIPQFTSKIPEFSYVANSFERLLVRLRGYRALNVKRLLLEKRRAEIIAASISDGIFLIRGEEVLYMNPVAERVLGLGPLPLWGQPFVTESQPAAGVNLALLAEEQVLGCQPQVRKSARAILDAVSRSIPVELTIEEEERKHYYLIQAYPISFDLVEQVENSVASPIAISQVLERFQATALIVAQDVTLVRESQEAKGHFLATLSHEIKTPVTSLTMATRLLAKNGERLDESTYRNLIKTCADDVDRLRVLLDDLLTISHFDTLTQRLRMQTIDLVKLLRHTVQTFQKSAVERGVTLSTGVLGDRKQVFISIDPSKIAWALSNLLTNALRHTPKGGRVETTVVVSEKCVEVRIKDTGPGIERKRQTRIFEKFSPFYDIRVARSGSTGTGLSIAREIVSAHGGRIWVASEPGSGAEFCFTLPIKREFSGNAGTDGFGEPRSIGEKGSSETGSTMKAISV